MAKQSSPTDPGNPLAVGSVLQSLPMDAMIAGPLMAAIKAEAAGANTYAEWIKTAGLDKDGKPIQIPFEYTEDVVDGEGKLVKTNTHRFSVPLLAILQHPAIGIDKATVEFEMTVETSEASHSETSGEGGFEAKMGWGPFSVKVHGKISHKSEQTRKTDTRSKYSFRVEMVHRGPTEAMSRIIDSLTDAAVKPVAKQG